MNWSKSFSSILVGLRSHRRNCWGMTHRTDGLCESMFFCMDVCHWDIQIFRSLWFRLDFPQVIHYPLLLLIRFSHWCWQPKHLNFTVYRVESFSGLEGPLWLTAQGGSSCLRLIHKWAWVFVVLNKLKWKRKWRDYRGITSALVWFIYCVERRWITWESSQCHLLLKQTKRTTGALRTFPSGQEEPTGVNEYEQNMM